MYTLPPSDGQPAKVIGTVSIGTIKKQIEQAGHAYVELCRKMQYFIKFGVFEEKKN
jgi:hypothetical protein